LIEPSLVVIEGKQSGGMTNLVKSRDQVDNVGPSCTQPDGNAKTLAISILSSLQCVGSAISHCGAIRWLLGQKAVAWLSAGWLRSGSASWHVLHSSLCKNALLHYHSTYLHARYPAKKFLEIWWP